MKSKICRCILSWLLIIAVASHIIMIVMHLLLKDTRDKQRLQIWDYKFNGQWPLESSTLQKKDIYYLKVHKTGSSTLQNILYRFAMKEQLRVALFNRLAGMPYPEKPLAKYLYEDITNGHFEPYNIMCDHAVFSKPDVNQYMESKYVTIALIREPLSHLKSAFKFWNIARAFRLPSHSDPLKHFLLNNPSQYSNQGPFEKFIQNMQAFHFGYTNRSNDPQQVERFVQEIRSQFDLVLILERFDESLILLKRLLRWEMGDIMYIKQFVNKEMGSNHYPDSSTEDHPAMRKAHREIALADYRLYELFNEKLQQQVQAEGPDFLLELRLFQSLKAKLLHICPRICDILTNFTAPYFQSVSALNSSRLDEIRRKLREKHVIYDGGVKWQKQEVSVTLNDCVAMNLWSQHFHIGFRIHQLPQFCGNHPRGSNALISSRVKNDWCDASSYLFFKFPLQYIHQYIFGELANGPKAKTRSYCRKEVYS